MTNTRSRPTKSRASIAPIIAARRDLVTAAGSLYDVDRDLAHDDPHHLGALAQVEHAGPAPKRIVTGYGFWIFLLSDMVMFSCFFAAYAVLSGQTAGGPRARRCSTSGMSRSRPRCLLLSSFTCGMASIAAEERNKFWFQVAMAVTCVLGPGVPVHRIPRVRRSGRARRRARRAARSCRRSSPWSAATACTSRPACSGC